MAIRTDNSTVSEHDSHSDSDWLDIASTDKDSDDNDSIYSSRETDHEDPSQRSRSRRSSLSYGSSRDGDVDAWEGLIEDSADDGMSNDVFARSPHVASPSQHPPTFDLHHTQDISPEELRVKEGLDQSMISTLSSSRSSSLHAPSVHSSTRDLRLSFPDPITSSCRELLSTPPEETQPNSDLASSSPDSTALPEACRIDDTEPSGLQMFSPQPQLSPAPTPSGPELKVFLFGFPTTFKWSIVNKLMHKVAHGAGVTIADLESLQGPVRRLTVSGSFEHDPTFPRTITVFDRTLRSHDTADDPALVVSSGVRPLAIVFMPCPPLGLPEHVLHLPIVLPSCSSELPEFANIETTPRTTSDFIDISNQQILRLTGPEGLPMIEQDSIDMIDASCAYRAFSRLWSGDNVAKGIMTSTHALTTIAILSLIIGLIVRATLPVSLQQFASPTLPTLPGNYTSYSLWQMIRPAPYRERLPPSTTLDSSVVVIPSSFKDSSLSVFSVESTSIALSRANPTGFRRVISPTMSERSKLSKELILQPPYSVLPTDDRPKALSVIPETSPSISHPPLPDATAHAVSTLKHTSVPDVVKECASAVLTIMNQDMQDIFDALDALVQAISRQTQMILTQATTFIEQSSAYMEKSVESFETVKGTLRVHNERAKRRAKEIKERGAKWLFDASEAVTTSARFSTGMARELAESLKYRAQRARGKAKGMAAELQDILNEGERLGVLGTAAWDSHMKYWDEWMEKAIKQEKKFCKRKLKSSIFC